MWKITLIIETDDEAEVERIAENVALAACPIGLEQLTAEHECSVPWMLIRSPLDKVEAESWRDDLNR